MLQDSFGNVLDKEVGYARGNILKDSFTERLKYRNAMQIINSRVNKLGEDSHYIFTGNIRANQLLDSDLGILSEEWIGSSLFNEQLKQLVISHLDGENDHEVAVFNRTSAGIISAILALVGKGATLFSFAPKNKCHPSVRRGVALAGANIHELNNIEEFKKISAGSSDLCVITGVTSELHMLDTDIFSEVIKIAKEKGLIVMVDDAYGARIRTVLFNQPHSLRAGADLVITNNDKAGLHGPRAGILAGKHELVIRVLAEGSEIGIEARPSIALGVVRSLEKYNENDLKGEVEVGEKLYNSLTEKMGLPRINNTILGPEISEDNLLKYMLDKGTIKLEEIQVVPAEVTAAVGCVLLEKYGIVTTNSCGMPGARPSIRLKSNQEIVNKFGGTDKVAEAVMDSIRTVLPMIGDLNSMKNLIFGNEQVR